jgi:hypothetical protein
MTDILLCRLCLESDGVESTSVVEHRCTDERTGKHFTANVCARCLEVGRETRVTCRTFTPSNHVTSGPMPCCPLIIRA